MAAMASFLPHGLSAQRQCEFRDDVELRGTAEAELHVEAGAGRLVVRGSEGTGVIHVSATLCASDRERLEALEVSLDGDRIRTDYPNQRWGWGNNYARIDLEIEVPASTKRPDRGPVGQPDDPWCGRRRVEGRIRQCPHRERGIGPCRGWLGKPQDRGRGRRRRGAGRLRQHDHQRRDRRRGDRGRLGQHRDRDGLAAACESTKSARVGSTSATWRAISSSPMAGANGSGFRMSVVWWIFRRRGGAEVAAERMRT